MIKRNTDKHLREIRSAMLKNGIWKEIIAPALVF